MLNSTSLSVRFYYCLAAMLAERLVLATDRKSDVTTRHNSSLYSATKETNKVMRWLGLSTSEPVLFGTCFFSLFYSWWMFMRSYVRFYVCMCVCACVSMCDVCVHVRMCLNSLYPECRCTCVRKRKVDSQGKLYITQSYVCFYATLLGSKTKVCPHVRA